MSDPESKPGTDFRCTEDRGHVLTTRESIALGGAFFIGLVGFIYLCLWIWRLTC